jgi:hypothetical protein
MNNISIIINLFLSIYIIINKNVYPSLKNIFNNNIFKIILLFIIIIINNPTISLLISISYIVTLQNINNPYNCSCKEQFGNCLCGSRITQNDCLDGQEIIHVNGLKPFCGNPKLHLG